MKDSYRLVFNYCSHLKRFLGQLFILGLVSLGALCG